MNNRINNNGFEYVDLGLPSGTLWATCNVGADKPSDSGLYFQWGDTKGYTKEQVGKDKMFYWDDYVLNPSADSNTFTKYNTTSATLELVDDAAHANMGGDWHIPSPAQIRELIDNTKKSFTILNGVKGMKFTSKKDSSKCIFIPAAGNIWNGSEGNAKEDGFIWTSMLNTNYVDCGLYLVFYSEGAYISSSFRQIGMPIRGVLDKSNDNSKGKKNDDLNLVEILKNAPKGTKLWSPVIGDCEFVEIVKGYPSPIRCKKPGEKCFWHFRRNGSFVDCDGAECVLFPSKENKNWEAFNVAKMPKHFEPFQKVLIRMWTEGGYMWVAAEYSNYDELYCKHYISTGLTVKEDEIIPYEGNEDKLGKYTNSENN